MGKRDMRVHALSVAIFIATLPPLALAKAAYQRSP
jgi:hypothetical protein